MLATNALQKVFSITPFLMARQYDNSRYTDAGLYTQRQPFAMAVLVMLSGKPFPQTA